MLFYEVVDPRFLTLIAHFFVQAHGRVAHSATGVSIIVLYQQREVDFPLTRSGP